MGQKFQHRLRYLRLNAGMTHKELAVKIGTTHGNVSKYELGETFPPMDVFLRAADLFGVSSDFLLGRDDVPKGSDGSAQLYILGADGSRQTIMIPAEKRERVMAMLSAGFPELMDDARTK